jgi:hypothetical protein
MGLLVVYLTKLKADGPACICLHMLSLMGLLVVYLDWPAVSIPTLVDASKAFCQSTYPSLGLIGLLQVFLSKLLTKGLLSVRLSKPGPEMPAVNQLPKLRPDRPAVSIPT